MGVVGSRIHGAARFSSAVLAACACALVCGAPATVHAFCRESTNPNAAIGDCDDDPRYATLHWVRNCMTYRFNSSMFARVPKGEQFVRDAFRASYQSWAETSCSNSRGQPFVVTAENGVTDTSTSEFVYDEPNESVVVLRERDEWLSLEDHDRQALALTLLWHDKNTGEILDVDMELNGGAGDFTDCETEACLGTMIDLQNTVTHEAGHLLGLGHSDVRTSTMAAATAGKSETTKRTLDEDDKTGYCALKLPAGPCSGERCSCPAPPVFPSHEVRRGCSVCEPARSRAHDPAAYELSALALAMFDLRRRQRRRH
jgi:hypothetical protein